VHQRLNCLHNLLWRFEIALEKAPKRYGAMRAMDGASSRAASGKFLVLLGSSGCGKTTVLRLIAGLEEVTEGRIVIGGRDVTRLEPDKHHLSMVFQSYALFAHLWVAEDIVSGLKDGGYRARARQC